MFTKIGETESVRVIEIQGVVSRLFAKIGKNEATELEVLRAAKELGVRLPGKLNELCLVNANGTLSPKVG